jgi:hypothetical protein
MPQIVWLPRVTEGECTNGLPEQPGTENENWRTGVYLITYIGEGQQRRQCASL